MDEARPRTFRPALGACGSAPGLAGAWKPATPEQAAALREAGAAFARGLEPECAAEELRRPLELLLPECASAFSIRLGTQLYSFPVLLWPGMRPHPRVSPMAPWILERWSTDVYVDNDVQPGEVFGLRVIGLDRESPRAACLVGLFEADGTRFGSLVAYHRTPGFFTAEPVGAVLTLASLLQSGLDRRVLRAA